MNLILLKKFSSDKEFFLYETLKLKKSLESRYLKGNTKVNKNDFRFVFKSFLITNSFSFLFQKNILELIKNLENKLNRNFSSFKTKGEKFEIKNINTIDNPPLFFDELLEFNLKLEKHNSSLIVQGSYADGTYISYSDLDLVIIGYLSKEVIEIKSEIDKFLLKIDPLQHHGVFFINKNSFDNYWQMDLPIETLKKSMVLSRKLSLEINIPFYFKEKLSAFNWVSSFLLSYSVLPITTDSGVFFAKYFISQLLLVPALFLATKGNYIYKRESFSVARSFYSKDAWKCITIASSIRSNWNQNDIDSNYKAVRKNSTIKDLKEFNILEDVVNINKEKIDEFAGKYNFFIKETKDLLEKI